jgi:SecD/SecF fusion protein
MRDFQTGEETNLYMLYAIKKERGRDEAPLDGEHVVLARSNPDPTTGEVQVTLQMDNKGAKIWADMTTKAAQDNNREIAIILDNEVVSAPRVNEPITGGNSSISGNFSVQEGKDLANILQIGKLPAETQIIQESLVGPSLGKENIRKSVISLVAGFGLVLLFMIFYYGSAGIVSILALFLNLFFIFGALASIGTVLTLPGIAGIVLTIGMAVDANVIIYERVREELRDGKSLKLAITDGFKNSYSAIIDANVTTLLVAFILAYFGLGPIKGFAVVLIIGVLSSLFTAVLISRLMIEWWLSKGRSLSFWTPPTKNVFANLNVDWMGKRKIAYVISGTILLAGLISFMTRGFEFGVDFKGGYSFNVEFHEDIQPVPEDIRTTLADVFDATPVVKAVDTRNTYNITTSFLINDDAPDAQERVMQKLYDGINGLYGGNIDYEQFKLPDGRGTHISSSGKVSPIIADDIQKSSVEAMIFALLFIFLYIFIRFSRWQFSLGAVAALFHDSLIVLACFSFFHGWLPFSLEIDQPFIAALLTVIGYSINDTVIVFDRIREYLGIHLQSGKSKNEIINMAINSTMSRTVITSLTTIIVILMLFIFGGGSIKGFAFAILLGIIVGTYSSVFIATPIMSDLTGELKMKETKKSRFSKAATAH